MRLSFLHDTSDRVELEDREVNSDILKSLESVAPVALGGKWDEKMEPQFISDVGRYRRYKYDSVRDLLRLMRNKLNHYRELPKDIQVLFSCKTVYSFNCQCMLMYETSPRYLALFRNKVYFLSVCLVSN